MRTTIKSIQFFPATRHVVIRRDKELFDASTRRWYRHISMHSVNRLTRTLRALLPQSGHDVILPKTAGDSYYVALNCL